MEGDTGHQDADLSQHGNELKLVNIDTSGEQASSPTCPLNLLVRSPLTGKVELELSDPFLIGSSRLSGSVSGVGGGGDRPVPTDELVDFREKGSREADGSGRAEDDLELIGDDALEQLSGEADMDNIFQEALALADQFSQLDKLDDADVSLVDSAPQSLPGDSELLSLDAGLLASLAEARKQLPPPSARGRPADDLSATVSPLDSSFPAPSGGLGVSTLRSASAAAVAQVAAKTASGLTPPPGAAGVPLRSASAAAVVSKASPAEVPASRAAPPARAPPARASPPVVPAVGDEEESVPVPEFSAVDSADQDSVFVVPAAPAPAPAASRLAATSRLAGRQRDSLAVTAGRRLVAPSATATTAAAPAASASASAAPTVHNANPTADAPSPAAAEDAPTYAELCEQASAEQRELELQADEEYENRQFEQLERRVSREDVLDVDSADSESAPAADTDSTDAGRRPGHPRSQLSRKETYICRPNTGTFKIDKRQRFGTFKVDKTGTFKVPRASAAAARSLPPEPPPPGDVNGNQPVLVDDGMAGDTPGSDMNGADVHSDSMNNTYFRGGDRYEERSPSPPRGLLSAGTPEREDAPPSALGRRAAALRRPLTSTPCRSVGSSGSSIGVTPIRAPPGDDVGEDSPVPMPMAALRGPGLRQPQAPAAAAAAGLRRPAATGLRQPLASGLRQPAASGLRQPAASGLRQPAASGLRAPSATGLRPPSASGLRAPSASGLRAPAASVSAGAARVAPARQTATQLRQSSAQSGSDSSVCSVRSLPGPNTSRSNPSLVADRSDVEPALSQRQPRQLPGPASRLPGRGGGVRRSVGGTGSLTNISLQAHHSAASGLRRPTTGRLRGQETSKLSLSQQPAGSERF